MHMLLGVAFINMDIICILPGVEEQEYTVLSLLGKKTVPVATDEVPRLLVPITLALATLQ